jgi:hypothetical protein
MAYGRCPSCPGIRSAALDELPPGCTHSTWLKVRGYKPLPIWERGELTGPPFLSGNFPAVRVEVAVDARLRAVLRVVRQANERVEIPVLLLFLPAVHILPG